jgi:hypothetical protein
MPNLEIRNLPDDVFQAGSRRREVLEAIKRSMQTERQRVTPFPEELIRVDRER